MSHQKDQDACIQVPNLEESNNGTHFQRRLKSTSERIINLQKYCRGWIHQRRNRYKILFWMCVIGLWLDPLFCYSLVINDDKKCLRVDKKLGNIAIVLRSVMDFSYIIHVISEFRPVSSCPQAFGIGVVLKGAWAITKRFTIDILSVLPLPQVVLLFIIPLMTENFLNGMKSFNIFLVLFQYVPRIIRIYPLFKPFARTSGILIGSATLNIFLYMLASHVVGAFWYLFAVERKTMCWQEACEIHNGCVRLSCDDILEDYTFLTYSCPIKIPNTTIFDFGIFLEALDSGIVDSTDFLQKFSYSFWFGLQSLSSLGQNLKTSSYFWEIFFAVIISIFGLILLVFLIGNMQTYLQYKIERLEEMRLKGPQIDRWMIEHSLPRTLWKEINKYRQYKWREIRGVENLLHNLPPDIRRDTIRHLCLDVIKKVPMFLNMDKQLSDAICDHLKQVFYIEHSCVARERDPLDKMLFITQGMLIIDNSCGERSFLNKGDFYGEELLHWALWDNSSLGSVPISKAVHAHTKVEAFTLTANDLKKIVPMFWWHFSKNTDNSDKWTTFAASAVQAAWRRRRRYHKKKEDEETPKSSLYIKKLMHRFAANAASTTRRAQEARSVGRMPTMLPQQPAKHDIIAEQL